MPRAADTHAVDEVFSLFTIARKAAIAPPDAAIRLILWGRPARVRLVLTPVCILLEVKPAQAVWAVTIQRAIPWGTLAL
ncbi:MAG: hypothetical protein WBG32_08865 [Nodosilinea sp.]